MTADGAGHIPTGPPALPLLSEPPELPEIELIEDELNDALRQRMSDTIGALCDELIERSDLSSSAANESSRRLAGVIDTLVESYVKLGGPLSALPPFSEGLIGTNEESLESQVDRLAKFILESGELPEDEGAVDTAIRLIGEGLARRHYSEPSPG